MDLSSLWDQIAQIARALPQSGLLTVALGAVLLGVTGTNLVNRWPKFARVLRAACTLGLVGVLLMVVLQLSRMETRFNLAVPELGMTRQVVEGGETRVRISRDGHFRLMAEIGGVPTSFLVDTGATLTAVSQDTAEKLGLKPRAGTIPVKMQTANGKVFAQIAAIDDLEFGNISARGLDVIIAPGLGQTNVVGMNFLSRLESWRVERDVMTLIPKQGAPMPPVSE